MPGLLDALPDLRLCGGPEAIKMWRPLSVTTNLGYHNFFFLFLITSENTIEFFVIFGKQISQ
jgi:hypothetical protein